MTWVPRPREPSISACLMNGVSFGRGHRTPGQFCERVGADERRRATAGDKESPAGAERSRRRLHINVGFGHAGVHVGGTPRPVELPAAVAAGSGEGEGGGGRRAACAIPTVLGVLRVQYCTMVPW